MGSELHEIGEAMLATLRENSHISVFNIWFRDLIIENIQGNSVEISINSTYKLPYLNKHFGERIQNAINLVMGMPMELKLVAREEAAPIPTPPPAEQPRRLSEDPPILSDLEEEEAPKIKPDIENPKTIVDRYTFENFLVADSNRFAYAAARAVARYACSGTEENENIYNPLFIYGKSGLGKTHLLYAITNEIKRTRSNVRIVYKKGEDFTTELINAIENKSTAAFRSFYRTADLLLIDDIQFIAGRVQTQEEFFHTFSALYEDGKQIILTSDRPPREIRTLEERLLTRFEWGQLADIQPPSAELRTAIIRKKSADMNLDLPQDVVEFLSENLTDNIRQIEGSLNRLKGVVMISGIEITLDMCRRTVSDFLHSKTTTSDIMDKIFRVVSLRYKVSPDDIKGRSRKENIATARHISIYLARRLTDLSQSAIGAYYDRDHTTILSSLKAMEKNIRENSAFAFEVEELIREIEG